MLALENTHVSVAHMNVVVLFVEHIIVFESMPVCVLAWVSVLLSPAVSYATYQDAWRSAWGWDMWHEWAD